MGKIFKRAENIVGKEENAGNLLTSILFFYYNIFKGLLSQGQLNLGLFGNGWYQNRSET